MARCKLNHVGALKLLSLVIARIDQRAWDQRLARLKTRWNREHEGSRRRIPFGNILDRVTRSDPRVTDYILDAPAKCPHSRREILEKTLIPFIKH